MLNEKKFINSYKDYETILRANNIDPKDYEDKSDEIVSNRLRICRQMRNYISHQNDPGFLEPSDLQIKFLDQQIKTLTMADDIAKKHVKRNFVCKDMDKACDVAKLMAKSKVIEIIVTRKDGTYEIVSIYDVIAGALESKTTKIATIKSKKPKFVSATTKIRDIAPGALYVVTDNGAVDGKFIGTLYI